VNKIKATNVPPVRDDKVCSFVACAVSLQAMVCWSFHLPAISRFILLHLMLAGICASQQNTIAAIIIMATSHLHSRSI
jgi:hypothetical protein